MLRPYAASLKSLKIEWRPDPWSEDMSLLTEFTQLEALSLPPQDAEESICFSGLKDMERLTKLDVSVRRVGHETVVEAFAALTRLKSLVLYIEESSHAALSYVSHLTDLTHLAVYAPML